jgi:hypothetical protein
MLAVDADHLGAHVRHEHGAKRAGADTADLKNA